MVSLPPSSTKIRPLVAGYWIRSLKLSASRSGEALVRKASLDFGADAAEAATFVKHGGQGAVALAQAVVDACESDDGKEFEFLYDTAD